MFIKLSLAKSFRCIEFLQIVHGLQFQSIYHEHVVVVVVVVVV